MERVAFRPVRDAAARRRLLITSFALSFLLQNARGARPGARCRGRRRSRRAWTARSRSARVAIQKLDIVIIGVTLTLLAVGRALLPADDARHPDAGRRRGLPDGPRARDPGRTPSIASAFALSGLLAAVAAILLTAQTGTVSPTIGVNIVLFAFIATIVGGMGSLRGAVARRLLDRCPDRRPAGLAPARLSGRTATRSCSPSCSLVLDRAAAGAAARPRRARARGPATGRPARSARRLARLMRPAPARTAVADAPERGRRPLAVLLTEGLWPLLVADGAHVRRRSGRRSRSARTRSTGSCSEA